MAAGVVRQWERALPSPCSRLCPYTLADSTTATSNSKGVPCASSVVGCGLAARRRSNIARRFCGFTVCAAGLAGRQRRRAVQAVRSGEVGSSLSACAAPSPPTLRRAHRRARARSRRAPRRRIRRARRAHRIRARSAALDFLRVVETADGAIDRARRSISRGAAGARRPSFAITSAFCQKSSAFSASPSSKYVHPMLI